MRISTVLAIVAASCFLARVSPAQDAGEPIPDLGDFRLVFKDATSEKDWEMRAFLMSEQGSLDVLVQDINEDVKLLRDVTITFGPGGPGDASYENGVVSISYAFVYETIDLFRRNQDFNDEDYWNEVEWKVLPVVDETVLHEIGHALIDVNQIPKWGENEEVVADQLAFFIVSDFYDSAEDLIAVAAHYQYRHNEADDAAGYSSEHPPDIERHNNYLCWIYGSNPERYAMFGQRLGARAQTCRDEYYSVLDDWDERLEPYWHEALFEEEN
jgi:hypothetical protein